jgi:phosphatidylglycerophosphate synthase
LTTSSRRAAIIILSYSLPNMLTYSRIIMVPLVVGVHLLAILAWAGRSGCAGWRSAVFIARGDYRFSRWLSRARAGQQHSAFGMMLDPIADKLLVASCLLMLAADETIQAAGRYGRPSLFSAAKFWCRACANISPACASACR